MPLRLSGANRPGAAAARVGLGLVGANRRRVMAPRRRRMGQGSFFSRSTRQASTSGRTRRASVEAGSRGKPWRILTLQKRISTPPNRSAEHIELSTILDGALEDRVVSYGDKLQIAKPKLACVSCTSGGVGRHPIQQWRPTTLAMASYLGRHPSQSLVIQTSEERKDITDSEESSRAKVGGPAAN